MFIFLNKDKIISYIISLSTVTILFATGFMITGNNDKIMKTSSNVIIKNTANTNEFVQ